MLSNMQCETGLTYESEKISREIIGIMCALVIVLQDYVVESVNLKDLSESM